MVSMVASYWLFIKKLGKSVSSANSVFKTFLAHYYLPNAQEFVSKFRVRLHSLINSVTHNLPLVYMFYRFSYYHPNLEIENNILGVKWNYLFIFIIVSRMSNKELIDKKGTFLKEMCIY